MSLAKPKAVEMANLVPDLRQQLQVSHKKFGAKIGRFFQHGK
ncbi:MAG: hypothetical protein RMX65_006605 [Nostoc sp. DedQUE01]|nr:hypothetical protein [Nostoc sp. DedQUE01]